MDNIFAGPGLTGALVEAGDPFELSGGDPSAVGSGLVFVAGDLVVGMLKPLVISNVTRIGDHLHFTFDADPSRKYAVEFSDFQTSSAWSVLTNIPSQTLPVTHQVNDPVSPPQRFYRVRGL
jgi:hypothetical protein